MRHFRINRIRFSIYLQAPIKFFSRMEAPKIYFGEARQPRPQLLSEWPNLSSSLKRTDGTYKYTYCHQYLAWSFCIVLIFNRNPSPSSQKVFDLFKIFLVRFSNDSERVGWLSFRRIRAVNFTERDYKEEEKIEAKIAL